MRNAALALALSFLLVSCTSSPRRAVRTAVPPADDMKTAETASALAGRGSYVFLKDACRIYGGLYAKAGLRERVAAPYVRAVFLLFLRERELGIGGTETFARAERLAGENPGLTGYRNWLAAAREIPLRVKGVVRDSIPWLENTFDPEELDRLRADLYARAPADGEAAYFYLALACPGKSSYDRADDRAAILAAHPGSIPILFRTGFCPAPAAGRFDEVLQADPEFWEAYGFRGEAALGRGEILSAEKDLLTAFARIPESALYPVLLASLYFFTEEFEKSILYCEKALALLPEYRDALLIKAIGLSQLGRNTDAIGVLNRIIEMRYYLQGEAHYWLAWNYHALNERDSARGHIEAAKGPMPTNTHVFSLSGTLALEANEPAAAEADFQQAVEFDGANDEALLGLARIAERRERWTDAAGWYERTITAMEGKAEGLKAKIEEIAGSGLAAERKAGMLARRESQLRTAEIVAAAAAFNAAVAWANAGDTAAARAAAERAAGHPHFKERAVELLQRIKGAPAPSPSRKNDGQGEGV